MSQQPSIAAVLAQVQAELAATSTRVQRLTQRLYCGDASRRLAAAGRAPTLPLAFPSQFGEDLFLWDTFEGQLDGFFIEVGAFDGVNYSVTYALEAFGWKGLLIEAIPERFQQCQKARPNSRVVHAALGPRGAKGTIDFTIVDDVLGGMMSYSKSTPHHMRAVDQLQKGRRKVTVPLTSMDELLKDHAGPIDLAVIDVEGVELEVLNGFDLLKHKPKVLILEDNARGADPALAGYMSTLPYTFIGWVGVNRAYVRTDLSELISRAQKAL